MGSHHLLDRLKTPESACVATESYANQKEAIITDLILIFNSVMTLALQFVGVGMANIVISITDMIDLRFTDLGCSWKDYVETVCSLCSAPSDWFWIGRFSFVRCSRLAVLNHSRGLRGRVPAYPDNPWAKWSQISVDISGRRLRR